MRELHVEGVAIHDDPDHAPVPARAQVKRWIGARAGQVWSREMGKSGAPTQSLNRKATRPASLPRDAGRPRAVEDLVHVRNLSAREPGDLRAARRDGASGRIGKAMAVSR